jgi:hypothetical protein
MINTISVMTTFVKAEVVFYFQQVLYLIKVLPSTLAYFELVSLALHY